MVLSEKLILQVKIILKHSLSFSLTICGLYYKHITIVNDDSRLTLQIVASCL
jgi:hypothetical protein